MKIWRIILLTVCLFSVQMGPAKPVLGAVGEEPTGLQSVTLWIQPEYDDHRLLVMMQGEITGVQIPATVRFLVPSVAEMYSAGSIDSLGVYSGGPPFRNPSAFLGWDEVSYQLTSNTFRVEYYDPIIIGDPDKTIAYEFRTLYPISNLQVIIQQPRTSTAFIISPPGQLFVDSEGFTAYSFNYPDVQVDSPLNFDIGYTKVDKRPSLAITGENGENSSSTIAAVILVGLVAVIAVFVLLRRRKTVRKVTPRKGTGVSPTRTNKKKQAGKTWYCDKCKKRLDNSFTFCPFCGSEK